MAYIKYNNNPLKKKTTDCVIRSLALALNKSWDEIYDLTYKIGKRLKVTQTDKLVYDEILKDYKTMNIFYFENGNNKRRF